MKCALAPISSARGRVVVRHVEKQDAAGREQFRARAQRAPGSSRCSSTSNSETASKLPGANPASSSATVRRSEAARAAELDRRWIEIDADRLPPVVARRLDDKARCCSRRRGSAARPCPASRCGGARSSGRRARRPKRVHAVLVAVDAEIADDVLSTPATRRPAVVRLVEGRVDVSTRSHVPAADDLHVILLELERSPPCRRTSGTRARVSSSSGMRRTCATRSSIGCVRFSIEAPVRRCRDAACRRQPAGIQKRVCRNFHESHGGPEGPPLRRPDPRGERGFDEPQVHGVSMSSESS